MYKIRHFHKVQDENRPKFKPGTPLEIEGLKSILFQLKRNAECMNGGNHSKFHQFEKNIAVVDGGINTCNFNIPIGEHLINRAFVTERGTPVIECYDEEQDDYYYLVKY